MMDEWKDASAVSSRAWEANAAFWDDYMGDEGNDFHRQLVRPATERLLDVRAGQHVLDVACGNGNFSRRLVALGARVTAVDGSPTMVTRATGRSKGLEDVLVYRVVDVTDESQLLGLGDGAYDAAVCNMAMMDVATLEPLARSLKQLLKPGDCFVFSVGHPCFNASGTSRLMEEKDVEGEIVEEYAIKVSSYITPRVSKGLAIRGQPEVQVYFHRPLQVLLRPFFEAGFVMDRIEEPVFELQEGERKMGQARFREIPWALVVRLRL